MTVCILPGEISRQTIPAGGRFSTRLDTGECLRIVDTHGQQAVDFLCYAAGLPVDRYNAANTMKINGNIYLGKETKLYSDRAQVLMRIVEDTCGRHDTIGGCCSAWSNFARYGVTDTPGCHANFISELACWSLSPSDVVANVNFFMNVPVRQDGGMAIEPGLSKPGDFVELIAETPVIAVLSNCPQRSNPAAGFGPTPIEVIVRRTP
jgi:urea carboxylase-associated protein 1